VANSPIIYGGSSSLGLTLLPPGTAGYLHSDTAGNITYTSGTSNVTYNSTPQTSAYSASFNDLVICSGASFNVTLPAITSANNGQSIGVVHDGTSLSQIYGIVVNTASQSIHYNSQTYSGTPAMSLYTNNELFIFTAYWIGTTAGSYWVVSGRNTSTSTTIGVNTSNVIVSASSAYTFTIPSSSVTIGAVYSSPNGNLFNITATIASSTTLTAAGSGAPNAAPNTLTKVSGTGPATLAYSATTSTGEPAFGTTTTNNLNWSRQGRFATVNLSVMQTATGTSGSGTYLWFLPIGMVADTSDIILNPVVAAAQGASSPFFSGLYTIGATNIPPELVSFFTNNAFQMGGTEVGSTTAGFLGSTFGGFGGASTLSMSIYITVPISGWLP
jgi:hypothetical protein